MKSFNEVANLMVLAKGREAAYGFLGGIVLAAWFPQVARQFYLDVYGVDATNSDLRLALLYLASICDVDRPETPDFLREVAS